MPASHLVAERTTITGSIGVYAAFPNVSELADKYGVKLNVIKAGRVKDSGSMFHEMSAQERQLWQDMVDHAYGQFLGVVREGRGDKLKYALTADIPDDSKLSNGPSPLTKLPNGSGKVEGATYVRQLADGGIFTADKALKYGLVDEIGYLDDAIAAVRKKAGLPDDCKVVTYERSQSLLGLLTGEASARHLAPAWNKLAVGLLPRLWYLAPQCDLAAILAGGDQ
jgi:protease-4